MNAKKTCLSAAFLLTLMTAQISSAQIATGGQYALDQSLIATGGATSSAGGSFVLAGSVGQPIAGQRASGQSSSVHAGFWHPAALAPTAAHVTVGGRVTTADGRGIKNVYVKMTDAGGVARIASTGSFGYFRFDDVEVGATYIFSVTAKHYEFAEPVQVRSIADSTDDLNFVALANSQRN
jgi:hypothetical protein